jgi:hypothetical protein
MAAWLPNKTHTSLYFQHLVDRLPPKWQHILELR